MREINKMIIHCSATPPDMDIGAAEINQWHKEKGWKGIGYHYVIRRNGVVEKGRSIDLVEAHCSGQNKGSIGICYIGGVDENGKPKDNRTQTQKESLNRLVASLQLVFGEMEICGHNEFSNKACPSFNVKEETWHY